MGDTPVEVAEPAETDTVTENEKPVAKKKPRGGVVSYGRELRIPYTRLYNAMVEAGLSRVKNLEDLKKCFIVLQRTAVPFKGMALYLDPNTTLRELVRMEEKYGR